MNAEATGSYEVLHARLLAQAKDLAARAEALNTRRLALFGGTELAVVGTVRVRTENNCVPRDITALGSHLLFGFEVFMGLKKATQVGDVFALHALVQAGEGPPEIQAAAAEASAALLGDAEFQKDFSELFQYYKEARLLQLRRPEGKLLAVFQTGKNLFDIKALRWAVDPAGRPTYVDNRGERDHVFPPSHDFEWTRATREDFVLGRHPHVSIYDEVFVETVGGDLTVKVENNTEDGLGIYREPVVDPDQGLDDGEVLYARLGSLILLKILPFGETDYRYLVFDSRGQTVRRIDAIGHACHQLPEDHGIVFPGGVYLEDGHSKQFEGDVEGMELTRTVRSPNGEDVLYVFHRRDDGRYLLLPYNLIRRRVDNAIPCHGYSLFADGTLVLFRPTGSEPTRVHTVQVWNTPFCTQEHAAQAPATGDFLENIGNAELVRAISDCLEVRRAVTEQVPSRSGWEGLVGLATRLQDAHHWLGREEAEGLGPVVTRIREGAGLILDEFEKVEALKARAKEQVDAAAADLARLQQELDPEAWSTVEPFVDALAALRRQQGHLITLEELRYVDVEQVRSLEATLLERFGSLSTAAVAFLLEPEALAPYHARIDAVEGALAGVEKNADLVPLVAEVDAVGEALELLTEVVASLEIADATHRTRILEAISEALAALNRVRALAQARRKKLATEEGAAEFAVQLEVFGQSMASALALADTPEKCDELLGRTTVQLEELESRFSELDELLETLAVKRDEVYVAFETRKQQLQDERQRQAENVRRAAERILESMGRRAAGLESIDDLNAFFASDAMANKVREQVARLRSLEQHVRADEIEARLKAVKEEAARALRDRLDLFEGGEAVLRLGRHRFAVTTEPLDLTLLPRDEGMAFHLTGTDYYGPVTDPELAGTRELWSQALVSENADVYRGEYLAVTLLSAAEEGRGGLTVSGLQAATRSDQGLLKVVRDFARERYEEGYERGVHDVDAALILEKVLALQATAGLLRFGPLPRTAALLFWAYGETADGDRQRRKSWRRRAQSLQRLREAFERSPALAELAQELGAAIQGFWTGLEGPLHPEDERAAGRYLFEELARGGQRFVAGSEAAALRDAFLEHLAQQERDRAFREDLRELEPDPRNRYRLTRAWVEGFLTQARDGKKPRALPRHALPEAVGLLLAEGRQEVEVSHGVAAVTVEGLLGRHPRLAEGRLEVRLAELLARVGAFRHERVPAFRAYQEQRRLLLQRERVRLRLADLRPRVMTSFVRNRLIDQVYLPLVGDNLAKQIGALGEGRQSDRSGLLLLISPPGYGKTTLMEYLAHRLGLVFVKINGPALGHRVTSLDPAEAPNATARQEVERLNLALEMGNNVLLYLDDIQHTSPELLQKFISLCDAQRRIEGVFEGRPRAYDLRGKRFAVCMAGNPYTESGERFRIPDMLANRADIYNLGDVLEGKDELFAASYLENSLTANPVLAPLASREPDDVYLMLRLAAGEDASVDQLQHAYSGVELEEMLAVLRQLQTVQRLLLTVNGQYIASAAQEEAYRTEPPFLLQGSYRNMVKLAAGVLPVMNEYELEALITDHYAGEAQTLTSGAEANLLKLAELRGRMTDEERARWEAIRTEFRRRQLVGGGDEDPATRVLGGLSLVAERLEGIGSVIGEVRVEEPVAQEPEAAVAREAAVEARDKKRLALQAKAVKETTQQLGRLAEGIEAVAAAVAATAAGVGDRQGASPGEGVGDYLQSLDQVLQKLAEVPAHATVVQRLSPGVLELMDRMVTVVSEGLIPSIQGIEKAAVKQEIVVGKRLGDLQDRALKELDLLRELVSALRRLEMG